MTTIYIAGKVTDVPVAQRTKKFLEAQNMLEKRGFKVINPIKLIADPHTNWHEAMDVCLVALKQCDAIYMLPCSVDSTGAQLELQHALDLNMDIYYELENVEDGTTDNLPS
ncbi:DUF4406 domain-containing protein [Flavobacterium sp. N1994]|uniref:DUF4406 domain-containing protein n=1 Tax=Flavobacterium sp. N1994 TaxID=2986827 RepID=UPI00222213C4|nr:DUF4406 domain-containing protein [Flavobacterium sp. N1994]